MGRCPRRQRQCEGGRRLSQDSIASATAYYARICELVDKELRALDQGRVKNSKLVKKAAVKRSKK
jgi:hypothetical protein